MPPRNPFPVSLIVIYTVAISIHSAVAGDGEYLKIPALGRIANLGTLYNARTESFLESVFKENLRPEFITTTQTPHTLTETSYSSSIAGKSSLFNIGAKVTMSIFFGLIKIHGSAAYLTQSKRSARQTEGALLLKTRTVAQSLQTYYEGLRNSYNTALMNDSRATHVVTGVQWGANVAISFADKHYSDQTKHQVSGSLAFAIENVKGLFSASGSDGPLDDGGNDGFSVKIFKDIYLPYDSPQSFKQLKDLIAIIPQSINQSHDGKGVPVEYILTPISDLENHLKFGIRSQNDIFTPLDESSSQEFVKTFDDLTEMEQRVNDLYDDVTSNTICILDSTRKQATELRSKFSNVKTGLKQKMKETLVKVRSGQMGVSDLSKIIEAYSKDAYSIPNVERKILGFGEAIKKIEFYKMMRSSYPHIEYVGKRGSLQSLLHRRENSNKVFFALFMKPEFERNDTESWNNNFNAFVTTLNQPFNKLVLIDCDFSDKIKECKSVNRTVTKQIMNYKVISEDVLPQLLENPKTQIKLKPTRLQAIGRSAVLGQLYDARTDSFLEENALRTGYLSAVEKTENDDTTAAIISSKKFTDKVNALGLNSDLQFSVLAHLFPLQRSGKYLLEGEFENRRNDKCQSNSNSNSKNVLYSQHLDFEEISVEASNSKFQTFAAIDVLMKIPATHFVTKIQYGFNSVFSMEPSNTDSEDECTSGTNSSALEKSAGQLKQVLSRVGNWHLAKWGRNNSTTSTSAEFVTQLDLKGIDPKIKIQIFSDIQGKDSHADVIDAGDLGHYLNNKFLPQQTQNSKGQPIAFVLYPIDSLKYSHGLVRPFNVPFKSMADVSIHPSRFALLREKFARTKNQIEKLSANKVNDHRHCVTDPEFSDLRKLPQGFRPLFDTFNREFKDLVVKVKSALVGAEAMETFLEKYENSDKFTKDDRYVDLDKMSLLEVKLEICRRVQKQNQVYYVGRDSFNELLDGKTEAQLLYYKPSWILQNRKLWLNRSQKFFQGSPLPNSSGGNSGQFIVDCDFNHEKCDQVTEPTIYEYKGGKFVKQEVQIPMAENKPLNSTRSETELTALFEKLQAQIDNAERTLGTFT